MPRKRVEIMKRRLFGIVLALAMIFSASVTTRAAVGSVDMGEVVQLGDFEGTTHYIVFYPKALETSDETWPVAVWANGTMYPPAL